MLLAGQEGVEDKFDMGRPEAVRDRERDRRAIKRKLGFGEKPLAKEEIEEEIEEAAPADIELDFEIPDQLGAIEGRVRPKAAHRRWSRVYAHHRTGPSHLRTDFAETIYWNTLLATGSDGTTRAAFDLSDRVTTWEVAIDAHGAGRVGQARAKFEAVPPIALEAKLPLELSSGDRINIPISVVCADKSLTKIAFEAFVEGPLSIVGEVPSEVALVEGRGRVLLPVLAETTQGDRAGRDWARIAIGGTAQGFSDRVAQEFPVRARGFPHQIAKSGVLEDSAEFQLALPEQWEPGSLSVELSLYLSPLSELLDGLDGILSMPHGCFEQASTSNYPNVLAMGYLEAAGIEAPAAARRANELMQAGYAKLVGYECQGDGFEWFGGSPAHESLSAYGLLQFHDMAQVFEVDPNLIKRTRAWLLSRRDGTGGFERNSRALDSFGAAPEATTDAYVTYALALTGTPQQDIQGELDRLEGRGLATDDPYEVALAAAACHAAGRGDAANALRGRLAGMQAEDGSLPGAVASITRSGSRDLLVESTALGVLAWLDDPAQEARVRRGVEWLLSRRENGRFGSTQATIQALRALTAYARNARRIANSGEVVVLIDDYEVERVAFSAGQRDPIVLQQLAQYLDAGAHRVRIEVTGNNRFPWALDVQHYAEQPADAPDGVLQLDVALDQDKVREGDAIPMRVRLTNLEDKGQPMALAVIGLPAGLECPVATLDALKEAGDVDLWEISEREIVLYWRDLAPKQEIDVILDCLARLPGQSTGPASRAYLYYTPDAVRWASPVGIEIDAGQ